jgi:hypothetical protein
MQKPRTASAEKTISIDGAFADWNGVEPSFKASKGNTRHRDGYGYFDPDRPTGNPLHYTNDTGRNDIIGAQVARDRTSVYFHVQTAAPLTSPSDDQWMRLLIDVDRNKATGWEGYDFMVGPYAADGKALLNKSSGDWNWTPVAQIDFKAVGSEMEIAVPRTCLNLPGDRPLDLEFKWIDNLDPSTDIMELYTCGDAAPPGRFNYRYHSL